jgi:CO/xanthine dehydrogenase Mo-binding subunit
VIAPYVGGGFGGKEDMTVEPYVALVAHLTGRPVRMLWSRSESLLARTKRHPITMTYRTGCDVDGRLVAHDIAIVADGGAYAFLSALVLLYATTCAQGPYRCPNVRIDARVAYTNHAPCSAFRGFGAMQVALAYEGQMDLLAERLGLDAQVVADARRLLVPERVRTGELLAEAEASERAAAAARRTTTARARDRPSMEREARPWSPASAAARAREAGGRMPASPFLSRAP